MTPCLIKALYECFTCDRYIRLERRYTLAHEAAKKNSTIDNTLN